ncbi:hypothetical protein I6J42_34805 (plasmid) [Streptomyces californicus]|uniref:Uncharacterized protein n=1 Tax=Streptomyces californicus TaxID=67351 RepID=A0ABD7D8S6_9ACTN|nr:hypothetical protein [Streptomyces californicus]QRV39238.1 hypothetical protein I6J42_34805 [Streptomyces californicus]QRV52690.1 hypothetical protein I6J43_34825 [Streptomyces californicus]
MADEQTTPEEFDLGAIQGTGDGPALPAPGSIPVTEIRPESESGLTEVAVADVTAENRGMLSVRYKGVRPTLVLTGGTVVPSIITVVDGDGHILAEYEARPAAKRITSRSLPEDQNELESATPDCKPISLTR